MRSLALITATALVLSGLPPAPGTPLLAQSSVEELAQDDPDQICAPFLGGRYEEDGVAGQIAVTGLVAPSPPPPPMAMNQAPVMGRMAQPGFAYRPQADRERYAGEEVAAVQAVAEAPVSTFAVDVDTGSYANVRRFLNQGALPPQAAVRTEEMLNYFRYDYPAPRDRSQPFSLTSDMSATPWNEGSRLLRIGLRGYDVPRDRRPPANLVFLVDVSGSMNSPDKLPLVQCSLALLANRLDRRDRVAIVVYAGAAGLVLASTSSRDDVVQSLKRLRSGGSTAGAAGIQLAYQVARDNMIDGGINRVVLATDGDFNVGITNDETLVDMVERQRDAGITLTTLGYGTGNYNEAMMEQIADHGNGNYFYIDSPREAQKVLEQELQSTLFTIAQDVKIQVEFNPAYVSQYRLIGYENRALREEDFANDSVDAGDIGAGHQVTALYEIVPVGSRGWLPERRYEANRPNSQGSHNGELAHLRLRYKLPGDDRSRLIEQPVNAALLRSAAPPSGDSAFIAAVAAYGQRLRGDPQLNGFDFADIRRLAGRARSDSYWRREFVELTRLAERQQLAEGGKR
ncbi:MAG: vWA domain-containing protein [Allosphingosinicella sp.]